MNRVETEENAAKVKVLRNVQGNSKFIKAGLTIGVNGQISQNIMESEIHKYCITDFFLPSGLKFVLLDFYRQNYNRSVVKNNCEDQ